MPKAEFRMKGPDKAEAPPACCLPLRFSELVIREAAVGLGLLHRFMLVTNMPLLPSSKRLISRDIQCTEISYMLICYWPSSKGWT